MTDIKRFFLRIFCCAVMTIAIHTVLYAQDSHWSVNPYDYQYDMTVYAQLKLNNTIVTDYSGLEVAAFVGNECRGVAEPQSADKDGTKYYWLYMRVRSNQESGEVISFKFYDKTAGTETVLRNNADFVSLAQIGTASSPYTLSIEYTITFETGGGSAVAAITQEYNSSITPPKNPERTGYSFNGWEPELPETMPAKDMTVTAKWIINQYTLTYKVDGKIYSESVLDYASAITPLEEPSKEGYTFSSWSEIPETMPAHDVLVEGTFSVNSYNVIYLADNVEVHRESVEYGATIPEYTYKPQEEYLVFNGWIGEQYETMPAHDVTYIADITNTSTVIYPIFTDDEQLQIHTINGVNIQHEGISTLPDGIYIINGEKVYIGN